MSDSQAAEAENAYVRVTGESRVYRLEQKGEKDFNAYCGGVAPATFSVAAQQPDWVLVTPSSGSLAITPGNSSVWKVKSKLGEDKPDGRIYLWNYHIKAEGYNAKDITVPFGKTVTYSAYKGTDPVLTASDWKVNSISKNNLKSITFTKAFWGSISWFTGSSLTPKPGIYQIRANLRGKSDVTDSGKMTVVNTRFIENINHPYGFDDFTAWSLGAADYYGSKKGYCATPHASVKVGGAGLTTLVVNPDGNTCDLPIVPTVNTLTRNPQALKQTGSVSFSASSVSTTAWYLESKLDGTVMGTLQVSAYPEKIRTCSIIAVYGGVTNLTIDNISSFPCPNASEYERATCAIFKQAVLKTSCTSGIFFKDTQLPEKWNTQDLYDIADDYVRYLGDGEKSDTYVFLLLGEDAEDPTTQGIAERGGHYVWMFPKFFTEPSAYCHEIGHNLNLRNAYDQETAKSGPDKSNLMNNLNGIRLRKFQWDKIQE
jgi:hypothetical protein